MNVDYILSAHGIRGGRKSTDEIPPPPVVGFKATANGDNIDLTWQNPDDTDFVGVRIIKNESGYPTSEKDGVVLYDGTLEAFTDVEVTKGKYIYYRAFTYDFDDNYQSGGSQVAREVVKADQTAPEVPTVSNKTFDSVTLTDMAGHEYSRGGSVWQSNNIFDGLRPDTSYVFYQRKKETELLKASPASPGLTVTTSWAPYDDPFWAPGPKNLVAGNMTQGYFGEVPTTELISGTALASMIGLSAGTAQFDSEPWIKSAIDGKVIYWAKKPFRYYLNWNQIDAAGAVDGSNIITIGDHQYRIRLFRGSTTNPSGIDGTAVHGSEWNRVVLPTHEQAKTGSWAYPDNVGPDDAPNNWNINYTDADLVTDRTTDNGNQSWTQEVITGLSTYRLYRGGFGVSSAYVWTTSSTYPSCGWRPVLEVVS